MKNLNWYHLRDSRLTIWQYTLSFFSHSFSQAAKNVAAQNVEGPMKAMADIRLRLEHGASVNEVNAAYEAHEFPELEKVDSQMAMIKAVERVGQSASVHEVLLQECIGKKEVDLQNVGFKALISTLSKESFKVDEVITQFQPEDFREEVVQERLAQLVTEAQDLDMAETTTTKSEMEVALGSHQSISQVTKKSSSVELIDHCQNLWCLKHKERVDFKKNERNDNESIFIL